MTIVVKIPSLIISYLVYLACFIIIIHPPSFLKT